MSISLQSASIVLKNSYKPLLKTEKKVIGAIPIVAVPLVAYMNPPGTREAERIKKMQEETKHIAKLVTKRTKHNTEELKALGVKDKDINKYLKSDGRYTTEGKNIVKNKTSFRGEQNNTYNEPNNDNSAKEFLFSSDSIDTSSDLANACSDTADDITDTIDSGTDILDAVSDTEESSSIVTEAVKTAIKTDLAADVIAGTVEVALAEAAPLVKFVKPIKDLLDGDFKKAGAGLVSRGVDIILAPGKLTLATLTAIVNGFIEKDKGKNFVNGFTNGFSDFYKGWAEYRDEVEDSFLERETKSEKRERLRQEALDAKEKKKQKQVQTRKEKELQAQIKMQRQEEEKHRNEQILVANSTNIDRLNEKRAEFGTLLKEYKKLAPKADISNFNNWESWDLFRFAKNIKKLKYLINRQNEKRWYTSSKLSTQVASRNSQKGQKTVASDTLSKEREDYMNSQYLEARKQESLQREQRTGRLSKCERKQEEILKKRNAFEKALAKYTSLKPDADISSYSYYEEWSAEKLETNCGILRAKIGKIKRRNIF